jgi:DNA polymerase-4
VSVATPGPRLVRRIAHFDLDTFFVSVERVRDPSLAGKPVLVGHPGGRGVVASASYESRAFGCRSAQPMSQALRRCPQAIVIPPHFELYRDVSRQFHAILADVTPLVESVGMDEAYADLTGIEPLDTGARDAAQRVRSRVRAELGLPLSGCIAGSRTTAKVGSDRAKPDGLLELAAGGDAEFLAPLPLRELPLAGPRIGEELGRLGVRTIGDLARLDRTWLERRFGRAGVVLAERARGLDPEPVRAGGREARSISREVTFAQDVSSRDELVRTLRRHAERVGEDLRRQHRRARTVTLKLRWPDFSTPTRSRTVERPLQGTDELAAVGVALLDELVASEGVRPVRLIGLGATNLVEDAVQLALGDERARRGERLDEAIDGIRDRHGPSAVVRGL